MVQSGGTTNATLHAPSHGPALATWCSAAARQIITKMNACPARFVVHKRCIEDWVLCVFAPRDTLLCTSL